MCGSAECILCAGANLHPLLEREALYLAENQSRVLLFQPTRPQVKEKNALKKFTLKKQIFLHTGNKQQLCFTMCWSTQLAVCMGCCLEGVLPLAHPTMMSLFCIWVGADIYQLEWSSGPGTVHLQNNSFLFIFIHFFPGFSFIQINSLLVGLEILKQTSLGNREDEQPLQTGLR